MKTLALLVSLSWIAQSSDEALERNVRKELENAGLETAGLQVTAQSGAVSLSGEVRDAKEKLRAIQAVFRVANVESVDVELRLLSSGTPDVEEEIWSLLMQEGLDPGIDAVLVEDRIATLRGRVPNDPTREAVVSIASSVSGVSSVVDELAVSSAATVATTPDDAIGNDEVGVLSSDVDSAEARPLQEGGREAASAGDPVVSRPIAAVEKSDKAPVPVDAGAEASSPPESRAKPAPRPDPTAGEISTRVAREIIHQIVTYPGYTVFDDIQFGLNLGTVTLAGVVTEAVKKDELERRIASLSGVHEIDNKIRVLQSSSADQKLREELFERIYGNALFSEYADHRNPPIHILVEAKGVILTGVVDEVLQRMVAEGVALNTFGVRSVQNRIRVREGRER